MESNNTANATASLVVGIVALVTSWFFSSWSFVGIVLGVVGIVLAASAFKDCPAGRPGHGMAVAGLVLSILAISFSGLVTLCACGLGVALMPLSCVACVL